jgi:osmotically inducible protein OsmC
MKRSGSAIWEGDLKNGKGTVSTDSGVLTNQQYSFGTRFENGKGTNPEELLPPMPVASPWHCRPSWETPA